MNKGLVESKFGSHAGRNSMLTRDVSKSPYKNPTSLNVPAPSEYAPKSHEMAKEYSPRNTNGFPQGGSPINGMQMYNTA